MPETRERILATAVTLFGERGFYGTKMSEVAHEAHVSPKTLYKHFSGKKELFLASREKAMEGILSETLGRIPSLPVDRDSFSVVRDMLKSYSDFIRENRGLARILAESVAIVDEDISRDQREAFANAVGAVTALIEGDVIAGRVRPATDPENLAWLFLSFAALLAYSVMLDLDSHAAGGFDPSAALDLFFDVMREP